MPTLSSEKAKHDNLKRRIATPSFAYGMMWFILNKYKSFLAFGKPIKTIPEIVAETADAGETEGEDHLEALSAHPLRVHGPLFNYNAE